jgi:hypothetical protein
MFFRYTVVTALLARHGTQAPQAWGNGCGGSRGSLWQPRAERRNAFGVEGLNFEWSRKGLRPTRFRGRGQGRRGGSTQGHFTHGPYCVLEWGDYRSWMIDENVTKGRCGGLS